MNLIIYKFGVWKTYTGPVDINWSDILEEKFFFLNLVFNDYINTLVNGNKAKFKNMNVRFAPQ